MQVTGPGPSDVLAFDRDPDAAGRAGGIAYFGFRLKPEHLDAAVDAALATGATLEGRGEFAPGVPYAIELWWEP